MTTLLAGHGTASDLLHELRSFFFSLFVADRTDDEASTNFSWPRGLSGIPALFCSGRYIIC
jgi:hypothetical protein